MDPTARASPHAKRQRVDPARRSEQRGPGKRAATKPQRQSRSIRFRRAQVSLFGRSRSARPFLSAKPLGSAAGRGDTAEQVALDFSRECCPVISRGHTQTSPLFFWPPGHVLLAGWFRSWDEVGPPGAEGAAGRSLPREVTSAYDGEPERGRSPELHPGVPQQHHQPLSSCAGEGAVLSPRWGRILCVLVLRCGEPTSQASFCAQGVGPGRCCVSRGTENA